MKHALKGAPRVCCLFCRKEFANRAATLAETSLRRHLVDRHGVRGHLAPSVGQRLRDAEIDLAMGGKVDDDLVDML